MLKTETLKQFAAATNAARLDALGKEIGTLHQSRIKNAEELASTLEPLAQAMAALTDETRQTLAGISKTSQEQAEAFKIKTEAAAKAWIEAAGEARKAALQMDQAGQRMTWRHYLLTVFTGLAAAMLVLGFWILRERPVVVQNQLDTKAIADLLKPAVIEALKHSKGK